jgi:hypothetical protein
LKEIGSIKVKDKMDVNIFIWKMHAFQKEHNITNQCISNSVLLRDFLISRGLNAKVKAVLSEHCVKDEKRMVLTCHMIVDVEGQGLVDASYDIFRYDAKYMDTISVVMKRLKSMNPDAIIEGLSMREIMSKFIEFIKQAEQINDNRVVPTDYMIEQLNYIETSKKMTLKQLKEKVNEKN